MLIFRFAMHPISAESSQSLATNHALSAESHTTGPFPLHIFLANTKAETFDGYC
jgi:hypothetical protein